MEKSRQKLCDILSGKASEGGYSVAGMENVYFSNPQANFGTEVHEIEHDSY